MRAVLSAVLLVPLVILSPARATTWKAMDDGALVLYAHIIVRGKITAVDAKSERYPGRELGLLEILEVVYGPPDLAKVRIVLDEHDHGLVYVPGDSGTWFLRFRPPGGPRAGVMQGWRPPVLAISQDAVFSASHPSTFWPAEPHAQRRDGKQLSRTPQEWERRREQLRRRVEDRLRKDIAALARALEAANRNLEGVRRSTTQPSKTDHAPKPSE